MTLGNKGYGKYFLDCVQWDINILKVANRRSLEQGFYNQMNLRKLKLNKIKQASSFSEPFHVIICLVILQEEKQCVMFPKLSPRIPINACYSTV